MICERCYQPSDVGEHGLGLCPLEPRSYGVALRPDSIPGGMWIANGLCNEDGSPKRYDSYSEIKLACAVKGIVPYHDVFQEQGNRILEDARHRTDFLKTSQAQREKRWRDEARAEKKLVQR